MGFLWIAVLFSLGISTLPTPCCLLRQFFPSTGSACLCSWKCRIPRPCLALPASSCWGLSSLHFQYRFEAHHSWRVSSTAPGNFPLPCPLLSQLILFSQDKGCPLSLLLPPALFSSPVCGTQSSKCSLEICL